MKKIITILLTLIMVLGLVPQIVTAEENILMPQERTFGMGMYTNQSNWRIPGTFEKQEIWFYPVPGKTYTVSSSDTSVLTVSLDPINHDNVIPVVINGLKPGKATVTLKESSGKVVGTAIITIKQATLGATGNYQHIYGLGPYASELVINQRSNNAVYSFKTSDPSITLYEDSESKGYIYVNASKIGQFTATCIETLNGVSRELKTINITIKPMSVKQTASVTSNVPNLNTVDLINYPDNNYKYGVFIEGQDLNFRNGGGVSSRSAMSWLTNEFVDSSLYTVYTAGTYNELFEQYGGRTNGGVYFNKTATQEVSVYKFNKDGSGDAEKIGTCIVTGIKTEG